MPVKPEVLVGGLFQDQRGTLVYNNDCDLSPVRRYYHITLPHTDIIRAWQAHRQESKWFHCIRGAFTIRLVRIDDWVEPSRDLEVAHFALRADESQVLQIPPGFANGFQALMPDSTLLVFSDRTLHASREDDYRYPADYWGNWDKL